MARGAFSRQGAPLLLFLFILLLGWTLASLNTLPKRPGISAPFRPVSKRATRVQVYENKEDPEVEALRRQVAELQKELEKREPGKCVQNSAASPPTTNLEEYIPPVQLQSWSRQGFNRSDIEEWGIDKTASEIKLAKKKYIEYRMKSMRMKRYREALVDSMARKRLKRELQNLSKRSIRDETTALKNMRQSILGQGMEWPNQVWKGDDPCKWQGIHCAEGGRGWVTRIDFPGSLRKMPDEIGSLERLSMITANDVGLEELTPRMAKLPLRRLRLGNNRLTHLPDYIFELPNLTELSVKGNRLTDIPPSFKHAPRLRQVYFNNNNIGNITSLEVPPSLDTLRLSNNNIGHLPADFGTGGENLKMLAVSNNPLSELPKGIENLKSLTRLTVRRCVNLKSFPKEVGQLASLKQLQFHESGIASLPVELRMIPLRRIFGFQSKLRVIPPEVFSGKLQYSLREFNCLGCPIEEVPQTLGNLVSLNNLNLHSTGLKELPPLSGLRKLEDLNLRQNQFVKLPEGMETLTNLRYLEVSSNPLEELPDVFGLMHKLEVLKVSATLIQKLPRSVGRLHSLQYLDAVACLLTELPNDIGLMRSLLSLNVGENHISKIPASLGDLPLLSHLEIDGNSLEVLENLPYGSIQEVIARKNPRLRRMEWARSPKLTRIDLSYCALEEVPPELSLSHELKTINFSHNRIRRFLPSLNGMPHLEMLTLNNNQMESFRLFDDVMTAPNGLRWVDLKHIELFSNKISSGVTAESIAKLFELTGQNGISLSIEDNSIRGAYDNTTLIEPFPVSSEVWMDMATLGSVTNIGEMLRSGQSISELSYSSRPSEQVEQVAMKLLASKERLEWSPSHSSRGFGSIQCSTLSTSFNTRILRLRECHCAAGFYHLAQSRTGEIRDAGECLKCVNDARCHHNVIECYAGFYLDFVDGLPTCKLCPDGARCTNNGVVARPGYWQASQGTDRVFSCPLSSSCLGGATASNSTTCTEGHYGPLCSLCRFNYYRDSYGVCSSCPSLATSIMYAFSMVMGVLGVLFALAFLGDGKVRGMTARHDSADMYHNVDLTGSVSEGASMMRILVGFLQVMTVFPAVYQVDWEALNALTELFRWINFDFLSASSLECVWEHITIFNSSAEEAHDRVLAVYTFYENMFLMALMPILISTLCAMFGCMYSAGHRLIKPIAGVTKGAVNRFMFRVILLTALLAYLPVSNTVFQFFKCRSFDGGATSYVSADLSLECYDARWMLYLPVALTILLFYTIGLPAVILLVLVPKSRGYFTIYDGDEKTYWWSKIHWLIEMTARTFSVYKKKYMWWDAVEMGRKLLITAVALHFAEAGAAQVAIALCICFGAVVLHLVTLPFESRLLNSMQLTQLVLIYLSLSIGVLKSLHIPAESRRTVINVILVIDGIFILVGFVKISHLLVLTGIRLGSFKKVQQKVMSHV